MTDRELLELAAKAAGYVLGQHSQKEWAVTLGGKEWNPLIDDGDALRLAVKLRITIDLTDCECCVSVYANQIEGEGADVSIRHSDHFVDHETSDPYAATRRAIVRAAAEIGKGMKDEN